VSKQPIEETTEKENEMEAIIFSFLAIVLALGGLWYHDVRHPPEEQAMETARKQRAIPDSTTDQSKEQLVGAHVTKK
jgi:hypothetical protein